MLATVHVAVGAALGRVIGDPYVTAPFSFISHYFLDAVPHFKWHKLRLKRNHHANIRNMLRSRWYQVIEPLFAVCLAVYLYTISPAELKIPVMVGIVFNQIPDLLILLEWRYKIRRPWPIYQIETATHHHSISFMGVFNQLVVLVPTLYYLLK